jgi:LemA protein
MITLSKAVDAQLGQIENVYQRRADLVPNLVNVVQNYAKHERKTLTDVINARAKATQVTLKADQLNQETLNKFQAAQGELSSALSRLMVTVEQYPNLKADNLFRDLMVQLEGTENRIAVERKGYIALVRDYNTAISVFPGNIIANFFNFKEKPSFQAEEGAKKAPKIKIELE